MFFLVMLRQQFRGFTMIFHHIAIINTSLSSSVSRSVSHWTDPLMQSKTFALLCIDRISRVRLHDHLLQSISLVFPSSNFRRGGCAFFFNFPLLTLAQHYPRSHCAFAYHSDSYGRLTKHPVRPTQTL